MLCWQTGSSLSLTLSFPLSSSLSLSLYLFPRAGRILPAVAKQQLFELPVALVTAAGENGGWWRCKERQEGGMEGGKEEESGLWMKTGWLLVETTPWTRLLHHPYICAYNSPSIHLESAERWKGSAIQYVTRLCFCLLFTERRRIW